ADHGCEDDSRTDGDVRRHVGGDGEGGSGVGAEPVASDPGEREDTHPQRHLHAQRHQEVDEGSLGEDHVELVAADHVRRTSLPPKMPRGRKSSTTKMSPKATALAQVPDSWVTTSVSASARIIDPTTTPMTDPIPPRMIAANALIRKLSPVSAAMEPR